MSETPEAEAAPIELEFEPGRLMRGFEKIGAVTQMAMSTLRAAVTPPYDVSAIVDQFEKIGVQSLAIVILTAVFSSLVMTVQFAVQLTRFGAKEYVGSVVAVSLARELGPVLTALMVGGRVGAGIAAELGSMVVTEQVDALRSMGADPIKKLVVPRVIAAVIALPVLTAIADVLGVLGARFIAEIETGVNSTYFLSAVIRSVQISDFAGGIIKTVFFGFFISIIACNRGLSTEGGTEGVGRATTETVVITSVVTLVADFVLTTILIELGL